MFTASWGRRPCVIDGFDPPARTQPAGVTVIVITYWAMTIPQLAQGHEHLQATMHAAIGFVSFQLASAFCAAACRVTATAGQSIRRLSRRVGDQVAKAVKWIGKHIRIRVGFSIQCGAC